LVVFFHVEENEPKEDTRVPLNPARRQTGDAASIMLSGKASGEGRRAAIARL
jgi:hypothetical protein